MTCLHRWLLDQPNGQMTPGRCRRCGDRRSFLASLERGSRDWHTESAAEKDERGVREIDLWPGAVGRDQEV